MTTIIDTKWRRGQNYWELADWSKLNDGTEKEIDHKYFEDLRKRIFLLINPHAGRKTVQETYSPWMAIKYAYGDATDLIDTQYWAYSTTTEEYDTITLSAGEYRFDNSGISNYSRPFGVNGTKTLEDADYKFGNNIECWDGDFTSDPTSHEDYDTWDAETKEQYVKDNPARYIKPMPFTNVKMSCYGTGFLNVYSLSPPISRVTGKYSNTFWQRIPFEGEYYSWSPRVSTKIVREHSLQQFPDSAASQCINNYWTSIGAYRYLPICTDPKEQFNLAYCYGDGHNLIDGKYMFIYKSKVELNKDHLTNTNCIGATGDYSVYCCSSLAEAYRRWSSFPIRKSYGILYDGHPPTDFDNDAANFYKEEDNEPFTEHKLNGSYQQATEYAIDIGNWCYPADQTYKNNFMAFENYIDDDGELYYDSWNPQKYSQQDDYPEITGTSKYELFWGENGSGTEKLLKEYGRYNWYLDVNYAPMFAHIKAERMSTITRAGNDFDERWIPEPTYCWRKTWKEGFGKPTTLMWLSEWGDPPGYIEGDCRMTCNVGEKQFIYEQFQNYYRESDVDDVISQVLAKLTASTGNPDDPTETYGDVLNEYYTYIDRYYYTDEEDVLHWYDKYEFKPTMLLDMRNLMLLCKYGRIEAGVEISIMSATAVDSYPTYDGEQWIFPPFAWSTFFGFGKTGGTTPADFGTRDIWNYTRTKARIVLAGTDKIPLNSTVYVKAATLCYPESAGCGLSNPLGTIAYSPDGEVHWSYLKMTQGSTDLEYEIKDDCSWSLTGFKVIHKNLWLSLGNATGNLFYETDWDDVPTTVWARDVEETTYRNCCICCDNPSQVSNLTDDEDAPISGDDDTKTDDTQPLWHDEPRIEEKETGE